VDCAHAEPAAAAYIRISSAQPANNRSALPPTRSASSNSSATPRTSVPVVLRRRGYVSPTTHHSRPPIRNTNPNYEPSLTQHSSVPSVVPRERLTR
jgi:hypothetical protein